MVFPLSREKGAEVCTENDFPVLKTYTPTLLHATNRGRMDPREHGSSVFRITSIPQGPLTAGYGQRIVGNLPKNSKLSLSGQ